MNTIPSAVGGVTKPSIPPPYKYKNEFDQLRNMGFPSRQIVAVLDSSEGNIDVAVAMLLSQHAQEVPDIPEEKVVQTTTQPPPPPALQRMFAAAAAATQPTQTNPREYTQVETKMPEKKRNVFADILDLLMDYPEGIDGCQLKPYFQQKYGRKLLIPEGESVSSWMRSIRGVRICPWKEGPNTTYYHENSPEAGTAPNKQHTINATKTTVGSGSHHHEESRANDWICSGCDSLNFEWRTSCHSCHNKDKNDDSQPVVEKPHDVRIMTTFKTKQCTNSACFSSLARLGPACPYWHTEKDRRRNPFVVSYVPVACHYVQSNGSKVKNTHFTCEDGETCGFTHNIFEALYHPLRYKKQPCRDRGPLSGPNLCSSKTCSFFHSLEESRNAKDIAMVQATAKQETAKQVATPVDEMPALKVTSASPRSVTSHAPSPIGAMAPPAAQTVTTKPPSQPPSTTTKPVEQAESNIPDDLLCCLSKKLMVDPVLATDGMTYERAVIERYIEQITASKRPLVSPVTGQPILHPNQVPLSTNLSIKNEIDAWRTANKVSAKKQ